MRSGSRSTTADMARIATFAALIAVMGLVPPLPLFGNVTPITLQTLGVMLAGAILGGVPGALSVVVFLLLVAAGMPFLAGGQGGLGAFFTPSAGFLIGWVPSAAVVGWLARPHGGRPAWWRVALGTVVGGILVVYAIGIPVQALVTGIPLAKTALLSLMFVPGDLAKAVVTVLLVTALARAYPRAFRRSGRGAGRRPADARPANDGADRSVVGGRS
ncbi:MAG TPA: biotin transporter BioY [Microbacteriaceae bacterium]|nr:biotin transporter BioY [Microbacteriaceae bacterium]